MLRQVQDGKIDQSTAEILKVYKLKRKQDTCHDHPRSPSHQRHIVNALLPAATALLPGQAGHPM